MFRDNQIDEYLLGDKGVVARQLDSTTFEITIADNRTPNLYDHFLKEIKHSDFNLFKEVEVYARVPE